MMVPKLCSATGGTFTLALTQRSYISGPELLACAARSRQKSSSPSQRCDAKGPPTAGPRGSRATPHATPAATAAALLACRRGSRVGSASRQVSVCASCSNLRDKLPPLQGFCTGMAADGLTRDCNPQESFS